MCETLGWREGLDRKPRQALAFYATVVVAISLGVVISGLGVNPIQGLFLAALLNGLAAPVLLGVIWWLARDADLLGDWRSGWWSQLLVGGCAVVMTLLPAAWLFT